MCRRFASSSKRCRRAPTARIRRSSGATSRDYLPARYGDVLEWKYIQGLTMHEIAERLGGRSVKAIESLLTRARDAFREGFAALSGVEP